MIGRRSGAWFSLLGALLACAFMAQGASAAWEPSTNMTAFTCVPGGGELDFEDPHCDNNVGAFEGEFGHEAIPVNQTTEGETISVGKAVLKAEPFGIPISITAEQVHGQGWMENSAPTEGVHRIIGEGVSEYTEVTLDRFPGCTVKEPIVVRASFESVEDPETGVMGGRFSPVEGGPFVQITIEGCLLSGTYPITGSAVAVGGNTGSTSHLEGKNEELIFGGRPASLTVTTTSKMTGGNPLSYTTVT